MTLCQRRFTCVLLLLAPLLGLAADQKLDVEKEVERLKSPFASEVVSAARNLANAGPDGSVAVPHLARALHRLPFAEDRIAVAKAISRMGPAAAEAVPSLLHVLELATFPNERVAIIRILGDLGPAGKEAVPKLTKLLKSVFADERKAAADALGRMGPAARAAIPALTEASQTGFGDVRPFAKEALRRIQAADGRSGIVDQGRLFSQVYLRERQREVLDLACGHEIDLLMETMPAPPKEPTRRQGPEPTDDAKEKLVQWAKQRVAEIKVDGVYVVATREPTLVHVEVVGKGRKLMNDAEARRFSELLLTEFRLRRYDHGLTAGIVLMRDTFKGELSAAGFTLKPGIYP